MEVLALMFYFNHLDLSGKSRNEQETSESHAHLSNLYVPLSEEASAKDQTAYKGKIYQ